MLLNFAFFIANFRFLPFLLLLFIFFILASVVLSLVTRLFKKKKLYLAIVFPLFFLLIISLVLINLSKHVLIYNYGENGIATVIQIENSNNMRNYQYVKQYNVLLKTSDGSTVETFFQDWDRNIYPRPSDGLYYYPTKGVEFPVRYIPQYPKTFIILGDVESDYSKSINCSKFQKDWDELRNKIEFDPENIVYKQNYADSLQQYVENNCGENEFLLDHYTKELKTLRQEIEALSKDN